MASCARCFLVFQLVCKLALRPSWAAYTRRSVTSCFTFLSFLFPAYARDATTQTSHLSLKCGTVSANRAISSVGNQKETVGLCALASYE